MTDLLTDEGFNCLQAESKASALKKISEVEAGPEVSLIVTDYNMPGGSGLDLFIELREKGLQIPFLFLSGETIDDKLAPYLEKGILGYELKPFDLMKFVSRVSSFLSP